MTHPMHEKARPNRFTGASIFINTDKLPFGENLSNSTILEKTKNNTFNIPNKIVKQKRTLTLSNYFKMLK